MAASPPFSLGDLRWPKLFRALGDRQRVTILEALASPGASMSVSEAGRCCGVHLSGASRHLAMLRDAGVLTAERRGREVHYRLDAPALVAALRGLADCIEQCCGSPDDAPGSPGGEA